MTKIPVWQHAVLGLRDVNDQAWLETVGQAREVTYPANTDVFNDGDTCKCFLLVLSGSLRVNKILESGRELVLYHVHSGQCCSLTTLVLMAGCRYSANAITEVETRVLFIPKRDFDRVFEHSAGFREFVCAELGGRFHDALMKIETLAMRNVEVRLARWLIQNSTVNGAVTESMGSESMGSDSIETSKIDLINRV